MHQGSTLELDEATSTDWIRVFADRSLLANVGGPQIEQRRGWLVGWLVGWVRECQSLYGGLFHKAWNNKDPYETTSVMESKRVFSWLKYRRLQVPNVVKQMNNEKKIMVFPVRGDLCITSLGEIPPIPLTWHWHRQPRTFFAARRAPLSQSFVRLSSERL